MMAEWTNEKEFDRPSTAQVEKLVTVMNDDYLDVSEMMKLCSIVRRKTMHNSYIAPALADGREISRTTKSSQTNVPSNGEGKELEENYI